MVPNQFWWRFWKYWMNALSFAGARRRLSEVSQLAENELDHFFSDFMFNWINGGVQVVRR